MVTPASQWYFNYIYLVNPWFGLWLKHNPYSLQLPIMPVESMTISLNRLQLWVLLTSFYLSMPLDRQMTLIRSNGTYRGWVKYCWMSLFQAVILCRNTVLNTETMPSMVHLGSSFPKKGIFSEYYFKGILLNWNLKYIYLPGISSHQIPKLKCFSSRLAVVFAQSIEARC